MEKVGWEGSPKSPNHEFEHVDLFQDVLGVSCCFQIFTHPQISLVIKNIISFDLFNYLNIYLVHIGSSQCVHIYIY